MQELSVKANNIERKSYLKSCFLKLTQWYRHPLLFNRDPIIVITESVIKSVEIELGRQICLLLSSAVTDQQDHADMQVPATHSL